MGAIMTPGREVDDLLMVAALLRIGVPLDEKRPVRTIEPAGARMPKYIFYFEERSRCGRFETEQLVKVWDDVRWMQAHPEHPWSYLWGMASAYQEAMGFVKRCAPLIEIEQSGLVAFVQAGSGPEMVRHQDKVFKRLADLRRRGKRSKFFND